ncbi:hypothetical protein D3C75_778210 [compost metagenome]
MILVRAALHDQIQILFAGQRPGQIHSAGCICSPCAACILKGNCTEKLTIHAAESDLDRAVRRYSICRRIILNGNSVLACCAEIDAFIGNPRTGKGVPDRRSAMIGFGLQSSIVEGIHSRCPAAVILELDGLNLAGLFFTVIREGWSRLLIRQRQRIRVLSTRCSRLLRLRTRVDRGLRLRHRLRCNRICKPGRIVDIAVISIYKVHIHLIFSSVHVEGRRQLEIPVLDWNAARQQGMVLAVHQLIDNYS